MTNWRDYIKPKIKEIEDLSIVTDDIIDLMGRQYKLDAAQKWIVTWSLYGSFVDVANSTGVVLKEPIPYELEVREKIYKDLLNQLQDYIGEYPSIYVTLNKLILNRTVTENDYWDKED